MKKFVFVLLGCFLMAIGQVQANPKPRLYIVEPANKAVVTSPFKVAFGLEGMKVAPAGEIVEGTGHHHLLINMKDLPPLNAPLPASENLIHFGKGQTETTLTLPAGEHTLQLVLANGHHIPHNPPLVSEKITITVK